MGFWPQKNTYAVDYSNKSMSILWIKISLNTRSIFFLSILQRIQHSEREAQPIVARETLMLLNVTSLSFTYTTGSRLDNFDVLKTIY